jgi:hypothetical protein
MKASLFAIVALLVGCKATPVAGTTTSGAATGVSRPQVGATTVTIAAAGDISDTSIGAQKATSDLIYNKGFDAVLLLGDNQYPTGAAPDYASYFDPTWGRFKSLLRPTPGNHDYYTPAATGYFAYFGTKAGEPDKGYYSYNLGAWHVIALNTNSSCREVPCNEASAQIAWLKADLQRNATKCTLAYWHHPRFNSGAQHGDFTRAHAIWNALYAAGAEVVLNGHEHIYERFEPQDPAGKADAEKGVRQFTVGTGGIGFYGVGDAKPNSAVRQASAFGVLKMTLRPDSYDWEFAPVPPSAFTDKGSSPCH